MTLQSESDLAGKLVDLSQVAEDLARSLMAVHSALDRLDPDEARKHRPHVVQALKAERDYHEAHSGPSRDRDLYIYDLTGDRDYAERWIEE